MYRQGTNFCLKIVLATATFLSPCSLFIAVSGNCPIVESNSPIDHNEGVFCMTASRVRSGISVLCDLGGSTRSRLRLYFHCLALARHKLQGPINPRGSLPAMVCVGGGEGPGPRQEVPGDHHLPGQLAAGGGHRYHGASGPALL